MEVVVAVDDGATDGVTVDQTKSLIFRVHKINMNVTNIVDI